MNTQLRRKIRELHELLSQEHAIDADTRQGLLILLADISRLLHSENVVVAEHTTADTLESLAVRFDADHPALSTAVRQMMDALAKAGI